jgi:hypothetical protein
MTTTSPFVFTTFTVCCVKVHWPLISHQTTRLSALSPNLKSSEPRAHSTRPSIPTKPTSRTVPLHSLNVTDLYIHREWRVTSDRTLPLIDPKTTVATCLRLLQTHIRRKAMRGHSRPRSRSARRNSRVQGPSRIRRAPLLVPRSTILL